VIGGGEEVACDRSTFDVCVLSAGCIGVMGPPHADKERKGFSVTNGRGETDSERV
jgi:hypothetical protein